MTVEECREELLKYLRNHIEYWLNESRATTDREKLEGLMHTTLATLDGSVGMFPGLKLIPLTNETDKQFYISNNENWWPDNVDIGGGLAASLFQKNRDKK